MSLLDENKDIFKSNLNFLNYGIWVDGNFSWLNQNTTLDNLEQKDQSRLTLTENIHDLSIEIHTRFICEKKIFQTFNISNRQKRKRNIKIFIKHNFNNQDMNEVTFYAPSVQAIIRSIGKEYLLMNGILNGRGIVQYCTDYQECSSLENGLMMNLPFSTGNSISIFSLEGEIDSDGKLNGHYWLCRADNEGEVMKSNSFIQHNYAVDINEEFQCLKV